MRNISDKFLPTQTLLQVSFRHIFICLTSIMRIPNSLRILYKTSLLNKSQAFFKSIKIRCTAALYYHFFSNIWWMQNIWSEVDFRVKIHTDDPPKFPLHMGLTLREGCWIKFCTWLAEVLCLYNYCNLFFILLLEWYHDRLLPLLRQFLLIPNRINMFMDLRENCSTPCFNKFCWDLINTWWFVPFSFSIVNYIHVCK
jgi:hypothetical protein